VLAIAAKSAWVHSRSGGGIHAATPADARSSRPARVAGPAAPDVLEAIEAAVRGAVPAVPTPGCQHRHHLAVPASDRVRGQAVVGSHPSSALAVRGWPTPAWRDRGGHHRPRGRAHYGPELIDGWLVDDQTRLGPQTTRRWPGSRCRAPALLMATCPPPRHRPRILDLSPGADVSPENEPGNEQPRRRLRWLPVAGCRDHRVRRPGGADRGGGPELRTANILVVTSISEQAGVRVVTAPRSGHRGGDVRVGPWARPDTIAQTRHRAVLAAAGWTRPTPPLGTVVLLPDDADESARRPAQANSRSCTGRSVGVLITDTMGPLGGPVRRTTRSCLAG